MTPPGSNPFSAGSERPRRRGSRGRGRPAAARTPDSAAPVAAPVVPVVPTGDAPTVLPTDTTFDALGVPAPLVEVLSGSGITAPFPIQVATLPDSLGGRDRGCRGGGAARSRR